MVLRTVDHLDPVVQDLVHSSYDSRLLSTQALSPFIPSREKQIPAHEAIGTGGSRLRQGYVVFIKHGISSLGELDVWGPKKQ